MTALLSRAQPGKSDGGQKVDNPLLLSCHSERSEESLISLILRRGQKMQRSFAFAQDDRLARLDQTAFSEITEITAGRPLDQVYGELEQANFPRVVHALYDRAEWFVFVLDLPPGAINYRVD